jgi:UPF0176 protein
MDPNAGKKKLINRLSPEELQHKLDAETFSRRTVSFYRYVQLEDPQTVRDQLFEQWTKLDCLGRIYLSQEGINAQMNVPEHNWDVFVEALYAMEAFKNVPFKIAVEDDGKSFLKLTVKVRKYIVADGLAPETYDVSNVGKHLSAEEWNEAMDSGKAIVVDIRNHYESEIGHFDGALLPSSETFKEELPEVLDMLKGKEGEKVLLYCTGGIRCEKTSAYLKHHGFKDVNQLHGGIIDYARQIKEDDLPNKFKGKNFVFDERLGEQIGEEVIATCHQCGDTCDVHVNCANKDCNLLFIQCSNCAEKMEGTCSAECQEIIHLPEEEQKKRRQAREQKKRFHRHRKADLK